QIATIKSAPTPEYFRGTMNADEGWALVDEKNPEVHTDSRGKIKSLGEKKANYRWMDRGDRVYTSHKDYFNKELKSLLNTNDIEYNAMLEFTNIGQDNKDIVRELKALGEIVRTNEKVEININKNGFYTGVKKQGQRI